MRPLCRYDQGRRFPLCHPNRLRALFSDAGLKTVAVAALEIPTVFRHFDDYWLPLESGHGPAPEYVASLSLKRRRRLRAHLRNTLPVQPDGSISLTARGWAVHGLRVEEGGS